MKLLRPKKLPWMHHPHPLQEAQIIGGALRLRRHEAAACDGEIVDFR
jgi:hypothetical protein